MWTYLHWMTAVWLVSIWETGAHVSLGTTSADLLVGTAAGADVLVVPDAPDGTCTSGIEAQAVFPPMPGYAGPALCSRGPAGRHGRRSGCE